MLDLNLSLALRLYQKVKIAPGIITLSILLLL